MLELAGVSFVEERVYRHLVAVASAPPGLISQRLGIPIDQVRSTLANLEAKGLVSRTSGTQPCFVPAPPDLALEPLILQRQHQLQQTRATLEQLAEEYRSAQRRTGKPVLVDVVVGMEAIRRRWEQLQRGARHEVLAFAKPPYRLGAFGECDPGLLERGVSFRAVYDRAFLDEPEGLHQIETYVRQGEQARVLDGVPMRLVVADRSIALVPLATTNEEEPGAILVRPNGLLDSLVALFETLWSLATPVLVDEPFQVQSNRTDGLALSAEDSRLLSLMRAGLTDEAIAKQLGTSKRTVLRRVRRLMDLTQTETRFQLGCEAAQRAWL
jgi:sugar-specific transcriptional regulator TrmB/DNA-binding CsgD family transcriptional regulator